LAVDGHGARQQVELRAARIEARAVDGDLSLLDRDAGNVAQRIEVWRAGRQRDPRRLDERAARARDASRVRDDIYIRL